MIRELTCYVGMVIFWLSQVCSDRSRLTCHGVGVASASIFIILDSISGRSVEVVSVALVACSTLSPRLADGTNSQEATG